MAITLKQEPSEIHSVFQNAHYTYTTSQTSIFNYYYKQK